MQVRIALERALIAAALATGVLSCSPKRALVNVVGNALTGGSGGWSQDDDPALVRDATPFALKTMESLIAASPENVNLLTAASSGFTSYGYAFVEDEADYVEATDRSQAKEMRARAKKLYVRARDYGVRGLEVKHEGFRKALMTNPDAVLAKMKKKDVPLLYWTAASWAAAISIDKTDASLGADLPGVIAMMKRAQALDPDWGDGAIWDFFVSLHAGLPEGSGGSLEQAKVDFDHAIAVSKGKRAAPYVAYAEGAAVAKQDKKLFQSLLEQALAVDPNAEPDQRLPNLISQKRARWLLGREDELFLE